MSLLVFIYYNLVVEAVLTILMNFMYFKAVSQTIQPKYYFSCSLLCLWMAAQPDRITTKQAA